jgi:hypothetical protein
MAFSVVSAKKVTAVSADYLWGVAPRSADDPLVASGTSDNVEAAQREIELVLYLKAQVAVSGTVTGPRGYHAVCRRDGVGGFTWETRGGGPVAGPRTPKGQDRRGSARPKKRRGAEPGRLYRDAQSDYWEARSRHARRSVAFHRFIQTILVVAIIAVVVVGGLYIAHHVDPRLSLPGTAAS